MAPGRRSPYRFTRIEDYERHIGAEAVRRILDKAAHFRDLHVVNVNSTLYGGGVAEILNSLTLLMNSVGIRTGWRVIQGAPDFFAITKKMHNAMQGASINLSKRKRRIYEDVLCMNAIRSHFEHHDFVIVHDPQPLPMIEHFRKAGPWIWRCHVDLSEPNPDLWHYLVRFIEQYDAVVVSAEEYKQELNTPQVVFQPAIDPFTTKNVEMSEEEVDERLAHYDIPVDLPIVTQVSRFDRWKDPQGVIEAARLAREQVDFTLVLLGNIATDDPEGDKVYHSLLDERDERTIILVKEDTALVNALQRRAAVVLQKSLREGFGLTVTEAMWKGKAVIGGNVGGIRHQITDGENGFLVDSVERAAERIVQLLGDEELRRTVGERARRTVRDKFLMTRLLEQYLDLFGSFETRYILRPHRPGQPLVPPGGAASIDCQTRR